ncbi:FG-GAP-like repeat-containing protein [Streptomyces sp. UH6]|uniref:FG-GAP-like repeat-containing protein n=1 Tax=Streptomyces sp. UH6 TaxID=2748379 RepID=UPI0015D4C675|nr:FG-GAP-like repeat-containing protein [Streptomyces sp. UH6]NYV75727.1 FG-GAP repeat protein [Streptomyces sp. UH6]
MKRRAWITLGAVLLGGGGVATYAMADPPDAAPAAEQARDKRPVRVYDLALPGNSAKKELPRTETRLFSMLGVSWDAAERELDGTAQVRTRSAETGEWSVWKDLEFHNSPPEDPTAEMRGASEPLWVGPADGVEVQVVREDGSTSAMPKGMQVNMIDPGVVTTAETKSTDIELEPAAFAAASEETTAPAVDEPTPPAEATPPAEETTPPAEETTPPAEETTPPAGGTTSPAPEPTETVPPKPVAPPSTVTRPPIVSRAQWGADESKVEDPAEYIEKVDAVFVHHTVGSNSYSCAQSASLVRGVMAYHIETNGWNDLGYNFLVDKCGQIFEGRGGGADLPVMGAHTYGFNGYSTGIAFLGDFEGVDGQPAGRPSRAALESAARLAAWKLGQYGGDPKGKVTLEAGGDTGVWKKGELATLNVISGHRDGYATACPGATLYAKLGEIRRIAASPLADAAVPTADFNRDGISDLVAGVPRASSSAGSLVVVPGSTDGPDGTLRKVITQSSEGVVGASEAGDNWGASSAWGDLDGDGYADLVVGVPGEDNGVGTDAGALVVLHGPSLTRTATVRDPVAKAGAKIGTTVAVGDFDADGTADVFSAGTGNGGAWGATLSGKGTQSGKLTTATGAVGYLDAATGDFNRDGYADVALNYRDQSEVGRVTWFKGSATGLTKVSVLSVKGGRSLAVGDVNGNGYDDIVIGQPYTAESGAKAGGQVTVVPGTSTGFTTTGMKTVHQDTSGVPGSAESGDAMGWSVSAGDYNLDGYADVLTGAPREDITRSGNRADAGMVFLLKGSSAGLTGTGAIGYTQDTAGIAGATETNDRFGSAVVLQDLSGWGRADLAIGVEGEDSYNGTILQLDSGSSGVSTSGGVYYGRTVMGTPTGGHLGQTLQP